MSRNKTGVLMFCSAFVLFLMSLLVGCTNMATPDIDFGNTFAAKVPFVIPARNAAAAKITKLSIVPLASPNSLAVATTLEGQLIALRFKEDLFYKLLVPNDLVSGGLLSIPTMQSIVVRDRTTGVLLISFAGQRVDQRSYQESRYECTDKTVKMFKTCPKGSLQNTQVSCEERTATVAVDLRMYDATERRIILSEQVVDKASNARCAELGAAPQVADGDLVSRAMASVVSRIQSTIAPTTQLRALDFMDVDASISGTPAATGFQDALKFGRAKRLEEACARFTDLYDSNKESFSLTYNVAFCDEAAGDLNRASSRYRRASELARAPNGQIDRHFTQVEKTIKEVGLVAIGGTTERSDRDVGPMLAGQGRRVALVIGNARYKRGALINPVNDARLMEKQLTKLGFDVTKLENLDRARFKTSIKDFAAKSRNAQIAMFYYAGHATAFQGENLLMPVDNENFHTMEEVRDNSVHVSDVLAELEVSGAEVKLVILDSCRDSPLPSLTRSLAGGLAPITPPSGSLVAFATSPGQTANDGDAANSVFTKYLSKAIQAPNESIENVFKQVRADVLRESKNRQKPTEISTLTGTVYLRQTK